MLLLVPIILLVILVMVVALRADQDSASAEDVPAKPSIIRSQRRR